MKKAEFIKKNDLLIIAVLVGVAVIGWLVYSGIGKSENTQVEIYQDNQLIEVIDLYSGSEQEYIIPKNNQVKLHLDGKGGVAFIESDCPDKVCINSGKQYLVGQSAACLPNGVVIKITSPREKQDADIVI